MLNRLAVSIPAISSLVAPIASKSGPISCIFPYFNRRRCTSELQSELRVSGWMDLFEALDGLAVSILPYLYRSSRYDKKGCPASRVIDENELSPENIRLL